MQIKASDYVSASNKLHARNYKRLQYDQLVIWVFVHVPGDAWHLHGMILCYLQLYKGLAVLS